MSKKKIYTPGMGDIERVMEHLSSEEKRARREEWIRQHYSKKKKLPKQGESNESNS